MGKKVDGGTDTAEELPQDGPASDKDDSGLGQDGSDLDIAGVAVELVRMIRDAPQFYDGPTTAEVHPDEVVNYQRGGWYFEMADR